MYRVDADLIVSPTDLTTYLACHHASALDHAVTTRQVSRPAPGVEDILQALYTRGLDHEHAYLDQLRADDRTIAEIDRTTQDGENRNDPGALAEAERRTVAAMAAGADVIYQATFFDGRWRGHADFLLRRDDRPGHWGWSYDVADTKLARRMKVSALLQMACYATRLTKLQGIAPENLIVVTGDRQQQTYPFADCSAYAQQIRDQLSSSLETNHDIVDVVPEPTSHCAQCRWRPRCRTQWRTVDDLSLVAFMSRDHARALRDAGITTVHALGSTGAADLPRAIGEPSRIRLADQACLQLEERTTGRPSYELLPAEPERGLSVLPQPSPGDLFFDIEGDPFIGDGGLEYLFGVTDQHGYTPFWATDPAHEKATFEALVDHLIAAWHADPGMHIYHYGAYEPTRLTSLAGRYNTRGLEIDRLLRGERLIDLYAVVRQGLRISKESYSIKQLEAFYWGQIRPHTGVADSLGSVVAFERWLATNDDTLLTDIADYNADDCRSTEGLRDWLEQLRTDNGGDTTHPRPEHGDGQPTEQAQQIADQTAQLAADLAHGIPDTDRTPSDNARVLLAGLLDWHRRESLPEWWEYFHRLDLTDEDLVNDAGAIGQLSTPTPVDTVKKSTVWAITYPPQDTRIKAGDTPLDPATRAAAGTVVAVNAEAGWIHLKRATSKGAPDCTSLVPGAPLMDGEHRARLRDLARWVIDHGIDNPQPAWRAARDMLLRHPPRIQPTQTPGSELRNDDETGDHALTRITGALDNSALAVQGPPGTGKTWAGARAILDLVAAGKRVGIAAFSHKAITNLVDAVCTAAAVAGTSVRIQQAAKDGQGSQHPPVTTGDSKSAEQAAVDGTADVVAGTSWLFARPGMADALDVLVVDEAGQLSLANVLAISASAASIVLLGDPQQLAQPTKGQHPDGAEASALEHLLDGDATVPADRGLLLDTTWRMHTDIATWISATCYDNRLHVEPGCDHQRVNSTSALGGTGLRYLPVDHHDNAAASTEEATAVATLCTDVLADGTWTDRYEVTRQLTGADILVLAPFNAQVNRLRTALTPISAEIRVGTVDKFQGQQAPVVIYSMASSTAEDAPRGLDFLYSLNRLNVAISRAQAVAAIVCAPALLTPAVSRPEQLRPVNALCSFAATATNTTSSTPR